MRKRPRSMHAGANSLPSPAASRRRSNRTAGHALRVAAIARQCASLTDQEHMMPLSSNFRIHRDRVIVRIVGTLAVLIASAPAIAEPLSDPETGLAVTPPPGYDAKIATDVGRYTAAFNVRKPDDKDTGCLIGFLHIPQKAHFTQAEINAYAAKPDWANEIRTLFSRLYDIISLDPFEHAGALGSVVVADRKMPRKERADLV